MTHDLPHHIITVDKAQTCLEYAQDNAGCRNCPHATTLRQQWRLEILEEIHNRSFDPTANETWP